ncbi:Tripartite tricarboxylate transporter family receptor [compost metagenome]
MPTYAELGYKQANDASWFGLVAPASTPAPLVLRVQQAVAAALKEPGVRDRLSGQGLYPSGTSPADFSRQIVREIDKMKRVAAYAKIKLD